MNAQATKSSRRGICLRCSPRSAVAIVGSLAAIMLSDPAPAVTVVSSEYNEDASQFIWILTVNPGGPLSIRGGTPASTGATKPAFFWRPTFAWRETSNGFEWTALHFRGPHFGDTNPAPMFTSKERFLSDIPTTSTGTDIFTGRENPNQETSNNPIEHIHNPKPNHFDYYLLSYTRPTEGGNIVFTFKGNHEGLGIPAIPEPSTWAMMLLGFASLAGAMRQARRKQRKVPGAIC
jgi:hypothetical protein